MLLLVLTAGTEPRYPGFIASGDLYRKTDGLSESFRGNSVSLFFKQVGIGPSPANYHPVSNDSDG